MEPRNDANPGNFKESNHSDLNRQVHNHHLEGGYPPPHTIREKIEKDAHWATYLRGVPTELRGRAVLHAARAAFRAVAKKPILLFDQSKLQNIMFSAIDNVLLGTYFKFELSYLDQADLEAFHAEEATDEELVHGWLTIERALHIRDSLHRYGLTDEVIDALADGGRVAAAQALMEEELAKGHNLKRDAAIKRVERAIKRVAKTLDPEFGH